MTSLRHTVLSIFLLLSLILSLASCAAGQTEVKQVGIEIQDSTPPYSEQTTARARRVIAELTRHIYRTVAERRGAGTEISDEMSKYLDGIAARALPLTLALPLSEAQYLQLIETLAQSGKGAIEELVCMMDGDSVGIAKAEELYTTLSSLIGADCVGALFYDITVLSYTVKYERSKKKYDDLPLTIYKNDMEAAAEDLRILKEDIGSKAFVSVMKNAFAAAELMEGGAGEGLLSSLSDGEMLILTEHLELSGMEIGKDGWMLLFSFIKIKDPDTYTLKLLAEILTSGDAERIAEIMDDWVKLMMSVQKRLTKDDISAIKGGRTEDVMARIFAELDDAELERFRRVCELELDRDRYSEIARAEHGAEYDAYLSSLCAASFDELCAARGGEDFAETLMNYLKWLHPAFLYEVSK